MATFVNKLSVRNSTACLHWTAGALFAIGVWFSPAVARAQAVSARITVDWKNVVRVSSTTPTLQVVVNPPLRRGSVIHDRAFQALRDLHADYVRFVPWMPYPRLGVAELQAPQSGKTFWDFSVMDPLTLDFLEATQNHTSVLNFSTIPQWMFKADYVPPIPEDPNQVAWDYEQGTELADPSGKQVGEYYGKLVNWYARGGFKDELGQEHHSGYSYPIPYWEVLNEPEYEHAIGAKLYTTIYDAVVSSVRNVSPNTKFVGASLATPSKSPEFFEYFLNPKNHREEIPLDYVSYHFYAIPEADESLEAQQHTFFAQADGFLNTVRYIEAMRMRLSPKTRTMINEVGTISAEGANQGTDAQKSSPIPQSYWNLSGALYAYLFAELSKLGIDVIGESQLVGYPGQFPSVSMLDWNTGEPNARYWALKLLLENFHPGDRIVNSKSDKSSVYAFAVITAEGKRRCMIINKRSKEIEVFLAGISGGSEEYIDLDWGNRAPAHRKLTSDKIRLGAFSVAVITQP